MSKLDLRREKEAANTRYAQLFETKTSRKHRRKQQRRARTERRELRVLAASGIERDERWPLA